MAETAANESAGQMRDLFLKKMDAEIAKLVAEIGRNTAETSRINKETGAWPWFPILVALIGNAGLTGIVVAIVVAVLRR
jgi:hypothetical protein